MKSPFIKGLNLQEKNEILEGNLQVVPTGLKIFRKVFYKQIIPTGQTEIIAP
jgi:hypothetical protein